MNTPLLAALAVKNRAERFRCEPLSARLSFRVCALRASKRGQARASGSVYDSGPAFPTCGTCATGAAIAEALVAADRLARKR